MAARDPQRARVYAWEHEWCDWNRSTLTLREARAAVHWACDKYGIHPPAVKQHAGAAYSFSRGEPANVISFRYDQRNPIYFGGCSRQRSRGSSKKFSYNW